MNINYIITAHERPLQLKRLVDRLTSSRARFYIHVDKKADIQPFLEVLEGCHNVRIINADDRQLCRWGGIGIVVAALVCMRYIIKEGSNGRCVYLSVQDYPIVSNAAIEDFFESNQSKDFMDSRPFPILDWLNGSQSHFEEFRN